MTIAGGGIYAEMLDEDIWAFIEHVETFYPPDTVDLPIATEREIYDRMCRALRHDRSAAVNSEDRTIGAGPLKVPVRVYRRGLGSTARARIVYFHGGGFVVGGLDSHDDICAEICAGTGCEVVSVAYRLAPEHRHPAAFEDALGAYDWACGIDALPLIMAGDSAGGNLAAAVVRAGRGQINVAIGQVLIYPDLGGDCSQGSYVRHATAPMLTSREVESYRALRAGEDQRRLDIVLCPLAAADFSGLPPTIVFAAECDPLASDGENYCSHIRAAGGKAICIEEMGLVHGYLRARRAADSFARIIAAFYVLVEHHWPYGDQTG